MAEEKSPAGTDADIEAGKGLAWLSYLGILFLVPMFANKDNRFSQFHARQGMVLCIVWAAWWIIFGILSGVFLSMAWRSAFETALMGGSPGGIWYSLYWIFVLILWVGWLFFIIMAIIGIIKSATGKYWRMPIFGGFVNKEGYPV